VVSSFPGEQVAIPRSARRQLSAAPALRGAAGPPQLAGAAEESYALLGGSAEQAAARCRELHWRGRGGGFLIWTVIYPSRAILS